MRPLTTALVLTAALARPAPARAQDPLQTPATPAGASSPAVSLARLTGPISLDGRSDDPAWASVPTVTPVMLLPTFEGQPTQRTEFRFAYDATYFYASARMYVARRDDIRGNSLQRDPLGSDNTLWDVATARTDSAWFAEMRIPLLSLRFQTTGGTVTMSNVRIRLHLNDGRDLFVVYNDHLNTERDRLVPALPLSQERALLVKLAYAFSP